MEHKGNVHDVVTRMREYVYMLEQAQDAIQLMQEPTMKHQVSLHDIDTLSVSVQDLGLDSRRTSETSSYITEDEDIGISLRKESQTTLIQQQQQQQQQQYLTIPTSQNTSYPRIHKRASFPALPSSPVLGPQKYSNFMQPQHHYKQQHHHTEQTQQQAQKPRKLKKPTSQPGLLLLLSD
jgi:hypothetical protein